MGIMIIKLMHVISDSNIGGAGKYLLTYLKNCNRREFEVSVAVPKGSSLIKEIKGLGITVYEIDGMAEKSISLTAVWQLFKLFLKCKPQIVHANACLSARIAGRLAMVNKIVYTRHSVFPPKEFLTKGIGKWLSGTFGMLLCDGIIAVAAAAKQNVTDTGVKEEKVEVIYNGVDGLAEISDEEKIAYKEKLGIEADEYVVSIIARLELVKGHEYFIDAAKIVNDSGIKARFVIAGTGSREDALRQYAKDKNASDFVIFTGFLTDVGNLVNITDVQANASFGTEAASLSLLEGMSIGKPAVVSDFGGNPELILNYENGFVVPKQNSNELARALIKLLSDKALMEKISLESRQIFNQKFTSEIMTKNMEEFYKKILGGR